MDTSTKLATFSLEEEVLTEYINQQTCQTVWAITSTFWAVYLQLFKLHFTASTWIISSFKLLFKFISPVDIISRRVQFGSVI